MVHSSRLYVKIAGLVLVVTFGLSALILVTGPAGAEPEQTFGITSISEGGHASDWFDLWVMVSGDPYEAYYGIDTDDPAEMEKMDDAGGDFNSHVILSGLEDGPHTIHVLVYNTTGATATGSVDIDVDHYSPDVGAITNHSTVYGDFVFKGTATDAYLNESAVYCMIDNDETAARSNAMTKVGDHFEFTIDTSTLEDGEHLVRIWAHDLWGNHNKSHAVVLFVSNKPNLVITAVEWTKTKVEAGQDVVVEVTVMNEGGADANNFKVSIIEGDKAVSSKEVTDALAPGASTTVTVKWSMDEEDSREVYLEVDTSGDVVESKEDDNRWQEGQGVTFEGGSPGFGALMAILATTFVALLAGRPTRR
jgi:archaellum component FlaF (FlaF/FlaG flagellin family)